MRAKKAVVAQLRAQGLKVHHYSARDIALLTEDYMAQHRARLIEEAAQDVARWPEFAAVSGHILSHHANSAATAPAQSSMKSQGVIACKAV